MILYRLKNVFKTLDIYEEKIIIKAVFWLRFLPWYAEPVVIYFKDMERVFLMKATWPFSVALTLETHQGRRYTLGQKYRSRKLQRIQFFMDRQVINYNNPEKMRLVSKTASFYDLVEAKQRKLSPDQVRHNS